MFSVEQSTETSDAVRSEMDRFDRLPEPVILEILNYISDAKTLIRLRSVSRRFNSLVPQADSLSLRLDRVHSPPLPCSDCILFTFFKSILKSLHDLLLLFPGPAESNRVRNRSKSSPAQILSGFERIRRLEVELPGGDVRLEKGAVVKWKAQFGRTLKSCVILGFRPAAASENSDSGHSVNGDADVYFARGLKTRVMWTISALIGASSRHFLVRDVIRNHGEMEELVIGDRDGEGTLVMDGECLAEARGDGERRVEAERSRTVVPSVRMSMWHAPKLRLKSGACMDGATLVIVRPSGPKDSHRDDVDDAELACAAFGSEDSGECGEAVGALLRSRNYSLEMNSF